MITQNEPQLIFDGGFGEREEAEARAAGYRSHAWAELPSGERYALVFYDPARLAQDLQTEIDAGIPCLAEPGLVLLEEVTQANMQAAVNRLFAEGYFDSLVPTATGAGALHA